MKAFSSRGTKARRILRRLRFANWPRFRSIALTAARLLKRSSTGLDALEDELKRLPEQMEWSFTQLWDALRSLAGELRALERFWLVGGGLYHPVVARMAWRFSALGEIQGEGIEASEFLFGSAASFPPRRGRPVRFRVAPESQAAVA